MSNLYEDLYLLTIHEDKGTALSSTRSNLPYGLAAALIIELALRGKLQVNLRHRVEVMDANPTGDEFLDEVLQEIAKIDPQRKIGYWINRLSEDHKKLTRRLEDKLVQEGVVTMDDKRILWVTPIPGSPEPCGSAKYWIKEHLRKLALANEAAELQDLALLNLVRSLDWLELIFTQDERKLAVRNLHSSLLSLAMKDPIAQTVEEIGEAVESVAEGY